MDLCNINEIKALLARHGFHFSKAKGQNFLTQSWVPQNIVLESGVDETCGVLEVGPGIGPLTQQLCRYAKKVVAVELDRTLQPILAETMAGNENLEIIFGDILKTDISALVQEEFAGLRPMACANLPYYITTPVLAALLESRAFEAVTVMVQKEAAQRICAGAGEKEYCAFSAQTAYYAAPSVILQVPRDRFIPQPKVDSVVLRLEVHAQPPVVGEKGEVFRAIRAGFANRRKTLVNGICMEYGKKITKDAAAALLKSMGLSENIRGEALSLEQFSELSVKLHNYFREIDGISANY